MTDAEELAKVTAQIKHAESMAQIQVVCMVIGGLILASSWFRTVSADLGNFAGTIALGAAILYWIGRKDLADLESRAANLRRLVAFEMERAKNF